MIAREERSWMSREAGAAKGQDLLARGRSLALRSRVGLGTLGDRSN